MKPSHYLEVTLRPDADLQPAHAMAALFSRLHLFLVATGAGNIAVSFPGAICGAEGRALRLGDVLRLLGSDQALAPLSQKSQWGGAASVAHISAIEPVPAQVQHHAIRRVQVDSNPERLIRRAMSRKGWTELEARSRYAGAQAVHTRLPFLSLRSLSSGHSFRLFLDIGMPMPEAIEGNFNAYGLSAHATVPIF